jgi:sarcosine oxidase
MGSAALYNLALRGIDVIGFDPLVVGEKRGSSHGTCRVFRLYNYENAAYTDLSARAFAAWSLLEKTSGNTVLLPSLVVEAGAPDSAHMRDVRAVRAPATRTPTCGAELNREFPAFQLPADWEVFVQDTGGILLADVALRTFRQGATGRVVHQAVSINRTTQEIVLTTSDGTRFATRQMILTVGPWITDFVPQLRDFVTITRQAVGWFAPSVPDRVQYPNFPIFMLDAPAGLIYGFPNFEGKGVKAANHNHGRKVNNADEVCQDASADDLTSVIETLQKFIPAAGGELLSKEVCLYTNTAAGDVDGSRAEEFIIDRLPDDHRIIVVSACSGHGFKFASAIGEIVAEMAVNNSSVVGQDFSLKKFSAFL